MKEKMNHIDYFRKLESDPEYQKAKAALKLHFALGDAVISARLQRNWTQSELARRVGTRQANISRIEAGLGNPTLKLIQKIIQVLSLEVSFTPTQATESSSPQASVSYFNKCFDFIVSKDPFIHPFRFIDIKLEKECPIPVDNWPISQTGTQSESHKIIKGYKE
jgi:transcriptional regulator with XRE-family HTH domain